MHCTINNKSKTQKLLFKKTLDKARVQKAEERCVLTIYHVK